MERSLNFNDLIQFFFFLSEENLTHTSSVSIACSLYFFLLLLFPKERIKSRERERSKIYFFLASVSSPLLHFRPHGRCFSETYRPLFAKEIIRKKSIGFIYRVVCPEKDANIFREKKPRRIDASIEQKRDLITAFFRTAQSRRGM